MDRLLEAKTIHLLIGYENVCTVWKWFEVMSIPVRLFVMSD